MNYMQILILVKGIIQDTLKFYVDYTIIPASIVLFGLLINLSDINCYRKCTGIMVDGCRC